MASWSLSSSSQNPSGQVARSGAHVAYFLVRYSPSAGLQEHLPFKDPTPQDSSQFCLYEWIEQAGGLAVVMYEG